MIRRIKKRTAIILAIAIAAISILTFLFFGISTMKQSIPLNQLIGQFDETKEGNFIALDSTVLPVNKKGMYLQKEAAEQLVKAYLDFNKTHPDIPFVIVSATRNYSYQSKIWQRKWDVLSHQFSDPNKIANEILKFSSMPGTSRHHWGTDVDITDLNSAFFLNDKKGKVLYQWLVENMPKYGFCQSFNTGRKGGYLPEEWHWSYRPISSQYLRQYRKILNNSPIQVIKSLKFAGSDNIYLEKLVREYVLKVNPDCY